MALAQLWYFVSLTPRREHMGRALQAIHNQVQMNQDPVDNAVRQRTNKIACIFVLRERIQRTPCCHMTSGSVWAFEHVLSCKIFNELQLFAKATNRCSGSVAIP